MEMPDLLRPFIRDPIMREWRAYLTPERRAHFERLGEASVQNGHSKHHYHTDERRFAEAAWLHELHLKRKIQNYVKIAFAAIAAVGGIGVFVL